MSNLIFVEATGPGIQALEFAQQEGHNTILLCSPRYDFLVPHDQRKRAVNQAIVVDDLHNFRAVIESLRAAGVDLKRVDAVLTTLHMCALPAAILARMIGARGTSPDAIAAAKDKGRCRAVLRDERIPSLGFGVVTDMAEAIEVAAAIGYPVVVKPASGFAKAVTTVARSADDVKAYFGQVSERFNALEPGVASELDDRFIIEEMAIGALYSVEVASNGRIITPLLVVRRKTGLENSVLELGSTVPCGLSATDEKELGSYAVRICRALGLDIGMFHVEIILTDDGPRLIEVNPRIAGGAIPDSVRAATGCNLFELLIGLYLEGTVPDERLPTSAAVSHSFLAAADDCTVRADLPVNWFETFRSQIHSGWTTIEAGVQLRRTDGNFDVYGVVRVMADDFLAAEDACTRITCEIADTLGIRLAPMLPPVRQP